MKCKGCNKEVKIHSSGYCDNCYVKNNFIQIPIYNSVGRVTTATIKVKNKKKARQYINDTRKKMIQDIINNPRKWLQGIKVEEPKITNDWK